ncbi:MAG: S41 family peptidase [Bacillota bacterium]|nr:S41 family peptidase [Bacillota bacterium]
MVALKKRNLVILLAVFLLLGGALAWALGFFMEITSPATDDVTLTAEEYEKLQALQKYEKLARIHTHIQEHFYVETDEEALMEGIYEGAFLGLNDIYSEYLTPSEMEDLMIATTGELEGVGVTVTPSEDGNILVLAPVDGSPAARAGIRPGDLIVAVDGTEYSGDTINAAVSAMRGPAGTGVELTVLRDGELLEFSLVRAVITQSSVTSEELEDGISRISITSFTDSTSEDFGEILRDLELAGTAGLVIDLRDNPGGVVDGAVEVADLLLEAGVVTYMENQAGEKTYYHSEAGATDIPFVLLVNGNTASGSEILAAAVKDNSDAPLVGTVTYGKGIVQEIIPLEAGDGIKLTVLQYFSPLGSSIHQVGIEPDYVVELEEEDFDEEGNLIRDRQMEKALELLRGE